MLRATLILFSALLAAGVAFAQNVPAGPSHAPLARLVSEAIRYELADKKIPALSIALVDGDSIVWAEGFGFADPTVKSPATASTVHRVGSVSKLFTDIALMRLVEQGKVALDAPVTRYLPAFAPTNRFQSPITVGMLMTHYSGLVRESPVGNYFDPTEPSLAASIASLNETEVIYPPGTRLKYSNAGIGVVGRVVEVVTGKPLAEVVQREILEPLQLQSSSFILKPALKERLAKGEMWTLHGRAFEAPKFELGLAPAACLYSTALDLAKFSLFLLNPANSSILKPETLRQMWEPQFGTPETPSQIGLGFFLSSIQNHQAVGHNGAMYGFATQFSVLPDAGLAVAVIATRDFANSVTDRLGHYALECALALRKNAPLPTYARSEELPLAEANALAGHYSTGQRGFELRRNGHDNRVQLTWEHRSFPGILRQRGSQYLLDSAAGHGPVIEPRSGKLVINNVEYSRIEKTRPAPLRAEWEGLIGEYGWHHDILYVLERNGQLWCLIEFFEMNPLTHLEGDRFKFPDAGMYRSEPVIFKRDQSGRATEVVAASVTFKRLNTIPAPGQKALKLKPTREIKTILAEAHAASPPSEAGTFRQPDLVELIQVDPTLKLDIRYAGTENFLGSKFYDQARAFLQRPAAEALKRVNARLRAQGYGLLIFDGYRPWFVTKTFWEATPLEHRFLVADPSKGSRHNRGAAVDCTLFDLQTGREVEMTGTYDEASDRTYPDYLGGTSLQRWHRDLLRSEMEREGFTVYPEEWWHFDFNEWRHYPIQNFSFEKITAP